MSLKNKLNIYIITKLSQKFCIISHIGVSNIS